ncbi:hippurate hydrolase [Jatrophihabitans endophyticus]|uniref:Hippurate hydrolase n=1 Tax=Jatrophihabitans endophyticus TaxID=1206085 RepID=A0A1M5U3M8_9ACTN|nr:M20 family metallopeptidase [Jatrophihabitans endophyticus]SHH57637.1 hippurate hydrolase [Jatrophihabitans endophyticus]
MATDLLAEARARHDDLVTLRRALHRDPELGLELPRTQQRVLAELDGLPLEIATGPAGLGSVVAVLRGRPTGRSVLLRADMDGLPVTEETGLDFAATTGTMHACGHDLHTTMLIGAARLLATHRDELDGDVVLMFQPGEEGYDGAGHMIADGVLDAAGPRAEAAFFMHVTAATVPSGVVALRPGPMMSAADTLHVTVVGTGGHASNPHRAQDPVAVTAEIVTALQTMVTRQFDVFDPVVITVGNLHAGTQHNIIPERAHFDATVRSFSPEHQHALSERAVRLCEGIAAAHGLRAEVEYESLYPVTVNDVAMTDFLGATAAELFGTPATLLMPDPHTGSEDFSRVLAEVPGAMAFLGATPPGADPDTAPFNHSPLAVFDEAVLPAGAALYAKLALDRLAAPAASTG